MRVLPVLVLSFLVACGAPSVDWETSWSAPYGAFDDDLREAFAAARADQDAGNLTTARTRLATLAGAHPDNLEIGAWLQDVELAILESREVADPGLRATLEAEPDPEAALRALYQARVTNEPSVAGFVLAARAETDAIAAQTMLDRALELDPTCAWAHYGKAHALLRDRVATDRWARARESLTRTFIHDPTHLRARRLEAWMLAQEGQANAAAKAMELWLEETEQDPRVGDADRHVVQLDLAIAWILQGHAREASELLLALEGTELERPRRLAILAVALHEQDRFEEALDVARRAERADPGSLLPVVHQAIVLQHDLDDREAAEARWREVAEGAGGDLASILQGVRAQVELERGADQ